MKKPRILLTVLACALLMLACATAMAEAGELTVWYGSENAEIRGNFTHDLEIAFMGTDTEQFCFIYDEEQPDSKARFFLRSWDLGDGKGMRYNKLKNAFAVEEGKEAKEPLIEEVTLCVRYEQGEDYFWRSKLINDENAQEIGKLVVCMPELDETLLKNGEYLRPDLTQLTGSMGEGGKVVVSVDGTPIGKAVAGADSRFTVALDRPLAEDEKVRVEMFTAEGRPISAGEYVVSGVMLLTVEIDEVVTDDEVTAKVTGEPGAPFQWSLDDGEAVDAVLDADGACELNLDEAVQGEEYTLKAWYAGTSKVEEKQFLVDGECEVEIFNPESEDSYLAESETISEKTKQLTILCFEENEAGLEISVEGSPVEAKFEGSRAAIDIGQPVPNETWNIVIKDEHGNKREYRLGVEAVLYAPITLTSPEIENDYCSAADESIVFAGASEPGQMLRLKLEQGGVELSSVEAEPNADGSWHFEVEKGVLEEGVGITLTVEYADGYMADAKLVKTFIIDRTAPVLTGVPAKILAGDDAVLSGTTEAGLTVTLVNGANQESVSITADENGLFSSNVVSKLKAGDTVTVRVEDAAGNVSECTAAMVDEIPLEPLTVDGETKLEMEWADGSYTLTGTAQPGENLTVTIDEAQHQKNHDEDVTLYTETVKVGEDGSWTYTVSFSRFISEPGETDVVRIAYEAQPSVCAEVEFEVDHYCSLTIEPAAEGDLVLKGTTDPEAKVWVYEGDVMVAGAVADQNGAVVIAMSEPIHIDDNLRVRAKDTHGNDASDVPVQIGAAAVVPSISFAPVETGSYMQGVRISGFALPNETISVFVNGRHCDTEPTTDSWGRFELHVGGLSEGENTITASYKNMYEGYVSDPLVIVSDITAPMVSLNETGLTTDSRTLTGVLQEKGTAVLMVNGVEMGRMDTENVFSFDIQPAEGDSYAVKIIDTYGNEGFSETLIAVEPLRVRGEIGSPFENLTLDCMDDQWVFGWALVNGELTGVRMTGLTAEPVEMKYTFTESIPEDVAERFAGEIEPTGYVKFEYEVRAKDMLLGEHDIQVVLTVNGAEHPLNGETHIVRVEKPGDYLPKRVFVMAALLLGAIIMVSAWISAGRKVKALRAAASAEDEPVHTMTIKQRKN